MILVPTSYGAYKKIAPCVQVIELEPFSITNEHYYINSILHILTGEMTLRYWRNNPENNDNLLDEYKSGIVSKNDTIKLSEEWVSFEGSVEGCSFIFSTMEDETPED